jgi:glucosamine kinase
MSLYLGIDAGGSKTECAVADEREIFARLTGGTCKIQRVGRELATEALQETVRGALSAATIPANKIKHCCIGISGASQIEVAEWSKQTLVALLPKAGVTVVGDNVIAHEAAFHGGPGVLLIAGTGSIAYGRNEIGETARAGGMGPLTSDEGSGYWIGQTAVDAVVRVENSDHSDAVLLSTISEAWRASSRGDLAQMAKREPAPDFAALFPRVLSAADGGDPLALEIMKNAGEELAKLALVVIAKLWPESKSSMQIAGAGGVLTNSPQVREALQHAVYAKRPQAVYGKQVVDPILGALFLARNAKAKTKSI